MSDDSRGGSSRRDRPEEVGARPTPAAGAPPRPAWVRAALIAAALVALVLAVLMLAGGHGPWRHLQGGSSSPVTVASSALSVAALASTTGPGAS